MEARSTALSLSEHGLEAVGTGDGAGRRTSRPDLRKLLVAAGTSVGLMGALAGPAGACPAGTRCAPPSAGIVHVSPIDFGARGSVARLIPADSYGADSSGRPVTAFVQTGDAQLRVVLMRWSASGAIDSGFGDGDSGAGVSQFSLPLDAATVSRATVAATNDGGLILAMTVGDPGASSRAALVRVDEDGRPVPGFGKQGIAVLDGLARLTAVLPLPDGRTAVGGASPSNTGAVLVVGADGAPDPAFGFGATAKLPGVPSALGLTPDGLAAGLATDGPRVRVARLTPTGSPDEQAGPGGIQESMPDPNALETQPTNVASRPDGGLVVVTRTRSRVAGAPPGAVADGAAVTRFPDSGPGGDVAEMAPGPAAVDGDGRVIVATLAGVTRYLESGSLDASFGRNGTARTGLPKMTSLAPPAFVTSHGTRVLVGGPGIWGGVAVATIRALRADGTRDTAFGERLLVPRQFGARLERRNFISLRVHCDDQAQRRCVVRMNAGTSTVRAFVAPGGDRRIRVRVSTAAARRIRAHGRAAIKITFTAIDETTRLQATTNQVVVRAH